MDDNKDQQIKQLEHEVDSLLWALVAMRAFRGIPENLLKRIAEIELAAKTANKK